MWILTFALSIFTNRRRLFVRSETEKQKWVVKCSVKRFFEKFFRIEWNFSIIEWYFSIRKYTSCFSYVQCSSIEYYCINSLEFDGFFLHFHLKSMCFQFCWEKADDDKSFEEKELKNIKSWQSLERLWN